MLALPGKGLSVLGLWVVETVACQSTADQTPFPPPEGKCVFKIAVCVDGVWQEREEKSKAE